MKNLFYLLILTIGFVACKKETIEPTPQQNVQTPPPNPTDTTGTGTDTTGTGTDTTGTGTVNDTIGKVKIYYQFTASPLIIGYGAGMSGRDYVQDTTNVRILRNGVKLTNHTVSFAQGGLNVIAKLDNPLWCSIGDTITMEIDSNEVNFTSGATSDRFLRTTFKVWKSAPYLTNNLKYDFDTHNYSAYPELQAIYNGILIAGNAGYNNYLGTADYQSNGLPQSYYIGGKLKLKYIVQ